MIPVSLRELANILSAELIGVNQYISEVTTDTRKVSADCLFVALQGKRFDAHNFACASRASALLVSQRLALDVPQLIVPDTQLALGKLAAWVRQQVPARIVALTGSSGKTSVKEMTAMILSKCGKVLYTTGNLNNEIGVPLTLLRLQPQHEFAVIELGANHIGEIAYTSKLTCPQAALINNLAAAHLEGFGSLSGVAKAKGEIFMSLPADGIAIINAENNDLSHWKNALHGKTVWRFSEKATGGVEFFASEVQSHSNSVQLQLHSPFGCAKITLPVPGRHNVANALAAAALAMSVGASLQSVCQGLQQLQALPGRIFPIVLAKNKLLLDDSYNANVGSMTTAIQVLAEMPGYRVMVVGDMAELGVEAKKYHRKVGEVARLAGIDKVISIGVLSQVLSVASNNGEHYKDKEGVIARVKELLSLHNLITILIKGSRSAAMNQIVCALQENTLC
ncbi:UDP-N-acetylmuramoyl-tripeptide--D-alanyl-D-alanine ligase [Candidatus Gillettellia adelgis]